MKIIWKRERQYHDKIGLIETGQELDSDKCGVDISVFRNWVDTGWAEEIRPKKVKTEEVK